MDIQSLPPLMQAEIIAEQTEAQCAKFEKLADEAEAKSPASDRMAAADARLIMANARLTFAKCRTEAALNELERITS